MGMGIFQIMNDVDYCLKGSIGQAVTDAKSLDIWTNCTMDKTEAWLTGKNNVINAEIDQLFGTPSNPVKTPPTPEEVAKFLQECCPGPDGSQFSIEHWSSSLALKLQMAITQLVGQSSTPADWNAIVGSIGPFSSMISSSMTQDTTTGDSQSKNMQSQLQTDNSALQPIADFGGTFANNINSLSNVLAQMSPS